MRLGVKVKMEWVNFLHFDNCLKAKYFLFSTDAFVMNLDCGKKDFFFCYIWKLNIKKTLSTCGENSFIHRMNIQSKFSNPFLNFHISDMDKKFLECNIFGMLQLTRTLTRKWLKMPFVFTNSLCATNNAHTCRVNEAKSLNLNTT